MKKKIVLIGSTGSIGTQTLDIVRMYPHLFEIIALTAGRNVNLLESQIREFSPVLAVLERPEDADQLKVRLNGITRVLSGIHGIEEAVALPEAAVVVNALVGSRGLIPTLRALEAKKEVALANKESLVTAGELVMSLSKRNQAKIIPVDSEHSAIFQCLQGEKKTDVRRILLTASGGPFRQWPKEKIQQMSLQDALNHPNWSMGKKITIDSATMMNKGLEVIEAVWLFEVTPDQIEVMVHPQSIIHSMVEFRDRSVIAQMGLPDMRVPIQYALSWPDRLNSPLPSLSLDQMQTLTFEQPDHERFPCLGLAREALRIGKTMPCVLNTANDILVEAMLRGQIGFYELSDQIERIMTLHKPQPYRDLEDILEVETWVKDTLRSFL